MRMADKQAHEINRKRIGPYLPGPYRNATRRRIARTLAARITAGLLLCLSAFGFGLGRADAAAQNGRSLPAHDVAASSSFIGMPPAEAPHAARVNFDGFSRSRNAQYVADWVVDSGDNRGMPFIIVDKTDARVFVFGADGRLRGAARALLGMARGDNSFPGAGNLKLSQMRPEEKTTPAGRFVASMGYNLHGKDVLWVDYDNGISLHRVLTDKPEERRLQRLATATPLDKRISHGCINVPAKFFDSVVKPAFTGTSGIVYVLPETYSIRQIFASYYEVR